MTRIPPALERLPELARNLWWSWRPEARGLYPVMLVDRLIHYCRTEHFQKPSCFCDARAEG